MGTSHDLSQPVLLLMPLFTEVRGRGILRSSDAESCIDPPREARGWLLRPFTPRGGGLHLWWWMGTHGDERSGNCNHARGCLMYTAPPRLPKDIAQLEGRRGVREDGDPAIRGLYRLLSGLPTPLCAQFHWPSRRRNIFLAFLIRSLRSSTPVSRARILRCSSVDL